MGRTYRLCLTYYLGTVVESKKKILSSKNFPKDSRFLLQMGSNLPFFDECLQLLTKDFLQEKSLPHPHFLLYVLHIFVQRGCSLSFFEGRGKRERKEREKLSNYAHAFFLAILFTLWGERDTVERREKWIVPQCSQLWSTSVDRTQPGSKG